MTGPEETQEVRREGTSTSAGAEYWSSAKNTTVLESAVFAQLKTGLRTATEQLQSVWRRTETAADMVINLLSVPLSCGQTSITIVKLCIMSQQQVGFLAYSNSSTLCQPMQHSPPNQCTQKQAASEVEYSTQRQQLKNKRILHATTKM